MAVAGSLERLAVPETALGPIIGINTELDLSGSPLLWTERSVENYWSRALEIGDDRPAAWLLLVRLAEAALLCAGNYADSCEFRAAGDFLVNPREIVVRSRNGGRSTVKKRHGRLSDQFGFGGPGRPASTKCAPPGLRLETTQPPLLPHMTHLLSESGRVASSFIRRLEEGQGRIADALAFLAAWRVFEPAELWRRLKASSPRERAFAESHLCRFDTRIYHRIGFDLRRTSAQPEYRSLFLIEPGAGARALERRSPATVLALAPAPPRTN